MDKVRVLLAEFYRLLLQTDRSQKSVQWLILRAAKHSWKLCLSRTEKRYQVIRIPAVLRFLPKLFFFQVADFIWNFCPCQGTLYTQHGANGKF